MFSENLFILALSWRQPGDALQLLMGNPDVEYSYKGCYSAIRKNDLLEHAEKWMGLKYTMVSNMIFYMFQCHSPRSSHPLPLPQSP